MARGSFLGGRRVFFPFKGFPYIRCTQAAEGLHKRVDMLSI